MLTARFSEADEAAAITAIQNVPATCDVCRFVLHGLSSDERFTFDTGVRSDSEWLWTAITSSAFTTRFSPFQSSAVDPRLKS
jgi:hypothetical protein